MLAEAMAIREALSWMAKFRYSNVMLKSDAKVVVKAINNSDILHSELGLIIDDCTSLLAQLYNVRCTHVRHSENCVANALARAACAMSQLRFWESCLPSHLAFIMQN